MDQLILSISAVNWARAQFALTAGYHWLFVPLTIGLALIMAIMESIYLKTVMRNGSKQPGSGRRFLVLTLQLE